MKERRHAFWVEAQRDINRGGGRAHAFATELIVMTEVKTQFGVRARAQRTAHVPAAVSKSLVQPGALRG